jgi:methyl-accepting chemotaxis protein
MLEGQSGLIMYSFGKDTAGMQKSRQNYMNYAERWEKALEAFRPLLANEEGRGVTHQLETELSAWRGVFPEIASHAQAGNAEMALRVANEKAIPIHEAATRDVNRLSELQVEELNRDREAAATLDSISRWLSVGLLALAAVLGSVTLFAIRHATRSLQRAAAELGESAEQVASASGQVSSSSQALAQGASEQAASLEETSASSEEITSMTRKNADNSRTAAGLMTETAQVVSDANRTLGQMETSMREINASSDKVSKIIKVIDEIAFQTNILALNAAVEAARAGEAGMGFAVVADEVRNLAQRSAQAAKDTASLIEESIAKSNEGRAKLDQVSGAIRNITDSAQKVKTLVDEVKLGSEEQARGIEQISKSISQMEQVTQKSAANAEETASAGEEMSAQAETMKAIVERVQEMVGGERERSSAMRTRRLRRATPAAHTAVMDLGPLHAAVSHPMQAKEPVLAGAARSRTAIPLDDDFKAF